MLRILLASFIVLGLMQAVSGQTVTDSTDPLVNDSLPVANKPAAGRDTLPIAGKPVKVRDTLPIASKPAPGRDSVLVAATHDSISERPWPSADWVTDQSTPLVNQVLKHHPYFGFGAQPAVVYTGLKQFSGKEILFYFILGLLLAFAFLKHAFPKYFNDLFRLLFRTTLKQKQIREQLMQTPLPSMLLNFFFAISGGFYIDLLLQHFDRAPIDNFWLLFLYCSLGLSVIYLLKFAGIKVLGWLLNLKEAADSYIFIVFVTNKVIGIFLLPFLVLLSFMQGNAYSVALVLSWCGLGVLYIYRFLFTYASVRNQVRFNPFHFLLYLCAFEAAPLLLIYKALLFFFP